MDAVFVEAFRNPELEQLGDGAVLDAARRASGWRSAPTRSSSRRCAFPGGSIGHLAVHGTVNDLAVSGRVPRWLSAAFVIEEGFAISRAARDRRRHGRRGRPGRACRWSPATPRWCPRGRPTASTSPPPGSAIIPAGRELGAARVAAGRHACCCRAPSATTAWRSCSPAATSASRPTSARTPPRSAGLVECSARRRAVDPVDARPDPRRPRHRLQRAGPGAAGVAVILDEEAPAGHADGARARATCSASTRSTWPTRASSSPSSRPTRPTPRSPRCGPIRWAGTPVVIGEIRAEPEGIVALRTAVRRQPDRRHARGRSRCRGSADGRNATRKEATCALEYPGQVVEMTDTAAYLAKVDVNGIKRTISVRLLAEQRHRTSATGCSSTSASRWRRSTSARPTATLDAVKRMGKAYTDELDAFRRSYDREPGLEDRIDSPGGGRHEVRGRVPGPGRRTRAW